MPYDKIVLISLDTLRADGIGFTKDKLYQNEYKLNVALGKTKLDELKISNRTLNALREVGIKTVGGLARKREATLREIEGIGDKGIQEIKKALGNFGITLKQ